MHTHTPPAVGFPGGASDKTNKQTNKQKTPPANAGDLRDMGLIPGSGRSPGGGCGNSLQYSYLENPHGQRSLVGYSAWGHKKSDMIEELALLFFTINPSLIKT